MRGYTLIESIMVIVIIGIVAAVGVPLLIETIDAWSFASRFQDNAVLAATVAQNRMSREIRRIQNDTSVMNATAGQFTFVDASGNSITYNRVGTTLMRNADGLADNVNALSFTYYDDTGAVIPVPPVNPNSTTIRLIMVDFSILAGSNTLPFRFQVRPQNVRRLNEKFK